MSSAGTACGDVTASHADRKSTRLNSSHSQISYAVFCLKKKKLLHVDRAVSSRDSGLTQKNIGDRNSALLRLVERLDELHDALERRAPRELEKRLPSRPA